jgi:hypothetical protein
MQHPCIYSLASPLPRHCKFSNAEKQGMQQGKRSSTVREGNEEKVAGATQQTTSSKIQYGNRKELYDTYLEYHAAQLCRKQQLLPLRDQGIDHKVLLHICKERHVSTILVMVEPPMWPMTLCNDSDSEAKCLRCLVHLHLWLRSLARSGWMTRGGHGSTSHGGAGRGKLYAPWDCASSEGFRNADTLNSGEDRRKHVPLIREEPR